MTRKNQRHSALLILAEGGVMLALATVLSMFKLADLPYGGSVTPASLLPVMLLSYRHGTKTGVLCALCYGVIQQLLGLNTLSYFSAWYSIVAIILLDYILAFAAAGLGGLYRGKFKSEALSLSLGGLTVCLVRYLCHVVSGATVWAGMSIPTGGALIYSFIYNATYMLPEAIILVLACYYLGNSLDFREQIPRRIRRTDLPLADWLKLIGGGVLLCGLCYDVARIFSVLQDGETGEFTLTVLMESDLSFFLPLIIVSAVALLVFASCIGIAALLSKKKN